MEVSGQLHNPAPLHPGKEPLVPSEEEAGWVPDMVVKKKILSPCWDSNPLSSSLQPSAIPLSYPSFRLHLE